MRPVALSLVRAALVLAPVALAFEAGGSTDAARTTALAAVWAVVLVAAVSAPLPPRPWLAAAALAGLGGLTAWSAVSVSWAPLGDRAAGDVERLLLFTGALVAGLLAWGDRRAARALEPLTAAGVLVVAGYALLGRAGLFDVAETLSANGRLEQPITYWNGLGALAAFGTVLCCRIAGDRERAAWLRAGAAAGAVPLVTALVLTYSRGALAALAGGVVVLVVLAPTWSQLRALAISLEAGALAAAAAVAADGIGLAAVPVLMAAAAAFAVWASRAEAAEAVRLGRLPLPPRPGWIAAAACVALVAVPVAVGRGASDVRTDATAARFADAGSNRDEYWAVALRAFAGDPLRGVGTGGFGVEWLREREIPEAVRDAHSLELEVLAELGLPGGLLLALLLGSVGLAGLRAQRADPVLAAGPAAALTCWLLHASLDWDWELPALVLPATGLAALLLRRAG